MGAHHYKIEVIPRSMDCIVDAKRLKIGEYWGTEQPPDALLHELRSFLPRNTSWGGCEEFDSGNDWGSDIRIWHEDDYSSPIFAVGFRLMFGADGMVLLNRFLDLIRKYGLLLYTEQSQKILHPEIYEVLEDFKQSTAFTFLSDPHEAILEATNKIETKNN